MRVDVSPAQATVPAGESATLLVTVVNTEPIISAHRITVLGADPAWVTVDQEQLSLFPDTAGVVTVTVQLPPGIPAGVRRIAVQVREITAPGDVEVREIELVVPAAHGARIELEPPSFSGGSKATVGVVLTNQGNAPADLLLAGTDADKALRFQFEPPGLRLAPGESGTVLAKVAGRRPLTGSPKIRQLTVAATRDDGEPVSTIGTFIQRPRVSRGGLGLVGLLAALSVFAAVIATTFGQVVDRSQDDRDLVLQALRGGEGGEGRAGTSGIAGTVTQVTDGGAVPGVTVELFDAADVATPVANVATGDDGAYAFEGLAAGRYKLRFRGAGFAELWFPLAFTADTAEAIDLAVGEALDGVDIRIGGVPGSIAGTVVGDDPAGATVTIRLPADAVTTSSGSTSILDPFAAPVVASAVVDGTGNFVVPDLPSPAIYDVLVQKEGFAAQLERVNLSAGEERTGLEIVLRRGDGTISGVVSDTAGRLGGATVLASDGATTVQTVSLTRDDVGAFTLRSLPTPATYTIVISSPGHVTETLTVTLGVAEEISGLDAILRSDAGSISGTVAVAGGGPVGGVRVRATDGETTVETVTLSTGSVGTYRLVGLPVPGTYTVSFEGAGLTPQTRAVDVDDLGIQDVTGIDATLVPSTATLAGIVRDNTGTLLGEVSIVLTSGDRTFATTSASEPAGEYELTGLPPGTYSVSFQRSGSVATVLQVTLRAGDNQRLDALLQPRARISGTVFVSTGEESQVSPANGAVVRLFRTSGFPGEPLAETTTDEQGRFVFEDLDAPESYVLDFATGPGEPAQQSVSIVLAPGESLDLATEPGVDPVVLDL